MKKQIISILLSVLLVLGTLPIGAVPAFADSKGDVTRTATTYIDENGETQNAENCIKMSSSEAVDDYSFEAGEWYVVNGSFRVNNRIENNAPADNPAHLILGFGAALHAEQGIHNPEGKGLVIYTHSKTVEGYLEATALGEYNADAAIGGNAAEAKKSGDLTINGGRITATGGRNGGAGIGGGFQGGAGSIVINDGTVTANGGQNFGGAGIGSGSAAEIISGEITINGGTVTATAGSYGGAGIGGGYGCGFKKITVNGGTVTATGGIYGGAGIGKGFTAVNGEVNGTILITGGTVKATGGLHSAGIGGGNNYNDEPGFKVDTITITGGEITATGDGTAAIGGGHNCPDHGITVISDDLEIIAGSSEEDAYYHNHELYLLKRAPYAEVHAIPTYTVKHLKQNADGTGYEEAETETLHGYTGEYTRAAFKVYDGFIPLSFEQQTVKKDSSAVVEILYDRIEVPDPVHEHTFSTEWSGNLSTHWHASVCGHSVVSDFGEHTFDDGVKNDGKTVFTCTVCEYKKVETEDETAKQLEEALAALADLEKQLEAKEAELKKLNDESDSQDKKIAALNEEINSLNSQLDAAKKEIERLKAQSGTPGTEEDNTCSKCGKVHTDDFWGQIVCFFNRIGNFFKNLFK
ncbi:MAG: hypothetical protein MJ177_03450 [Clostridia bacterium]|nr:hypothetical protein [Clostridia bacterium]